MKLTPEDIADVCKLVDELAGIQWDASKTYLIESRLPSLLEEHRCEHLRELVALVRSGRDPRTRTDFIDAVTTRETLFFRDESPFDALRHKALPEIIDAKAGTPFSRRLRFWSAACSSGQEPYSLSIVLHELIDDIEQWDIEILATDISPAALDSARRAVYSDFEMSRGVSETIRDRYFHKVADGWQVCDAIRKRVRFEHRNLLEPFTLMGPFDVVFCRNVAIYFDLPVKRDLFERLAGVLQPQGAIFVGGSENLSAFGERWKPQYHCRGIFYQPNRTTKGPAATKEVGTPVSSRPNAGSERKSSRPVETPRQVASSPMLSRATQTTTPAVARNGKATPTSVSRTTQAAALRTTQTSAGRTTHTSVGNAAPPAISRAAQSVTVATAKRSALLPVKTPAPASAVATRAGAAAASPAASRMPPAPARQVSQTPPSLNQSLAARRAGNQAATPLVSALKKSQPPTPSVTSRSSAAPARPALVSATHRSLAVTRGTGTTSSIPRPAMTTSLTAR